MDFYKLEPYQGKLAELGVPTLLLWGAEDEFAPLGGARRFEREIPGAKLVALEGAGHFVFDQQPSAAPTRWSPSSAPSSRSPTRAPRGESA